MCLLNHSIIIIINPTNLPFTPPQLEFMKRNHLIPNMFAISKNRQESNQTLQRRCPRSLVAFPGSNGCNSDPVRPMMPASLNMLHLPTRFSDTHGPLEGQRIAKGFVFDGACTRWLPDGMQGSKIGHHVTIMLIG